MVIPITLAPFGAKLHEVFQGLGHLRELDKGCHVDIGGRSVFIISFPICFTGDMVEQQELAGCLGHQAIEGCRGCLIAKNTRASLDFDVVEEGRYHPHMAPIREFSASMRPTNRRKTLNAVGLEDDDGVFQAIQSLTPALDTIRTRPADAAHSELTSLVKNVHRVLIDIALKKSALEGFLTAFQTFPLPPGFKRIQSPTTHLGSWKMTEFAYASILTPVVLRFWLKDEHLSRDFVEKLPKIARTFIGEVARYSTSEILVLEFWSIALSNILVCGRSPPTLPRQEFLDVVLQGRRSIELLFHMAASASTPESI